MYTDGNSVKEAPLLSIIVPVYNTEKYLPAFLDCLLKTCTQKLELILVDDGSTDSSGLIADRYEADYPFIRVLHLNNSGPAAARNAGIVNAHTQYITFMDSDDYIDPEAFNRVLMRLDKIPAQLWVSGFHRVDDRGNILDRVYQIDESTEPITDPTYLTTYLQGRECVWNVWRYIYRRDFLLENGLLFDESSRIAEDLEFIVRVLGIGCWMYKKYNHRFLYYV